LATGSSSHDDGRQDLEPHGLKDGPADSNIAVDPRQSRSHFRGGVRPPVRSERERGIYRSLDGGRTFQAVLQKGEDVGGNDVDIDPSDPNIVYATMWEERQGPWEDAQYRGTGGGIFKSTDGGSTWRQLTKGLPGDGRHYSGEHGDCAK
jgi:hypothetical protein